ncbi:MAG TPA: hypothetical protein VGJ29_19265 [Vicinamibacterales bacterium]
MIPRPLSVALAVVGALASAGCRGTTSMAAAAPRQVLFIGNSLTTTNDVPGLVEALSIAGGERIVCKTVAFGGYSLEDHWNQGDARRAIAKGGWTTVVLQQGPSSLPESRVLLVDYARRFADQARRVGATTALYMVWPSADRLADFDGVKTSYAAAARAVGGVFLPAGEAWRAAWKWNAQLAFYGPDRFHPTPLGSYLAALVIYQRLSGRTLVGTPSTLRPPGGPPVAFPVALEAELQRIATETNARIPPD